MLAKSVQLEVELYMNASLAVVLRKCASLEQLKLKECTGLGGIKFPTAILPLLKFIWIDSFDYDDQCLASLLSITSALCGLSLRNTHIDGASLSNFVSLCPQLIQLSIAGTKISDQGLQQIAQVCPDLQRVDVGNCASVTDVGILSLLTHCVSLHGLFIPGTRCSDASVHSIVDHCPTIKMIDFSDCNGISEAGKGFLLQSCRDLESLCLSNCTTELLKLLPPTMLDLILCHTVVTDEGLSLVGSQCKNLLQFDCAFKCDFLYSEDGLAEFIYRCTKLEAVEFPVELPKLPLSIWKRWLPKLTIVCDTDRWILIAVNEGALQ